MKKSLLIALGVATLATTVLTMTFNATNVSDNLSADPVEPNHTYVFDKDTPLIQIGKTKSYKATKTLDSGNTLDLNVSFTSDSVWKDPDAGEYDSTFLHMYCDNSENATFVFSIKLFSRVNAPVFTIVGDYSIKEGTGSISPATYTTTSSPTPYYSYVAEENYESDEERWSINFSVTTLAWISIESIALSYTC